MVLAGIEESIVRDSGEIFALLEQASLGALALVHVPCCF